MASKNDSWRSRRMIGANGGEQLTRAQELELSQRFRVHGDLVARDQLVRSQLATVATIARTYRRYSSTVDELIAEGNFGLVHAIAKFDPERGTRLVTYAAYWIRAYILAYLTRSKTLVSSGVHSKLLGKLRRERTKVTNLLGEGAATEASIAERLNVSQEKLRSLSERLELRDLPLHEDSAESGGGFGSLVAPSPTGEETLLFSETRERVQKAVSLAMKGLDARERYIVQNRLMAHREDELSLAEIGRNLGVSRERARQLEARAKRKIKNGLARESDVSNWSDAA
ncbi:MAG: sigma-70 family RNA polymerase sigma factor [Polyangiaceae bacterium]